MFESLSDRITNILKDARGESKLTEDNIKDAIREVRRALLEADVSLRVVKSFISNIKDRALGEEVLKSLSPTQQFVKVVYDELVKLMGQTHIPLSTEGKPNMIMLLGLQGSGKTTSAAKLALRIRKNGRNPLLVAADVYRPAAIDQLITLGKQVNVPVFTIEGSTDVQQIVEKATEFAKAEGYNTLIIDTAGRLQIDTDMMAELVIVDRMYQPAEKLLVIDAMIGQESVNVAETFDTQLSITGVVLTKLDGDARGGSALSITHATGKPIKFVSEGEKIAALEPFHPERMAQRILGMGDMLSLIEKAQETINIDEAKELERKMLKKEFSLEDFLKIQKQMKMLGSMDQILGMLPIPNISKADKEQLAHAGEQQLKRIEAAIYSMTPDERRNTAIINPSRKARIAKGAGLPLEEVNRFLREFEKMRKMMKDVAGVTSKLRKGKGKNKFKLPPGFKGKFPGM
ncbi:MAG: signal recognition particle protein [Vampirovibrionia bacterium]